MGEAKRRQQGGEKRARFFYLMKLISRYTPEKIFRFAKIRKL